MSCSKELLVGIFSELNHLSLTGLRQVSKFLKNVVDESVVLQYKVELAKVGMENGRASHLREHRAAWESLSFESVNVLPPAAFGVLWDLQGGVFARTDGPSSLVLNQLPGHARGLPAKEWRIQDVGRHIRHVKIDPSQDMLVLVEHPEERCILHLRTMSTGDRHPLVSNPDIVVSLEDHDPEDRCAYTVVICDDTLALMFLSFPPLDIHEDPNNASWGSDIFVWNWKTSGMIADRPLIEVYDISNLPCPNIERDGTNYLCAFAFEPLNHDHEVSLWIEGNPAPVWTSTELLEAPFYPSRRNQVLVASYNSDEDPAFVRFQEAWSRDKTVRSQKRVSSDWFCYVNGARYVRNGDGELLDSEEENSWPQTPPPSRPWCQQNADYSARRIDLSKLAGLDDIDEHGFQ
ncbi:hypothetical protein OE88DRAFT_1648172 [Heliocybe sulcata]|uniref:F-box domain-containing protein n=1 Tax=Heliocybe sulcata TaxID=5364 RepID=A0A5C3MNT6_9AGAM|nr:hypothetical protein OE88DRAFT_1648172 [Heliocybe sulcata]